MTEALMTEAVLDTECNDLFPFEVSEKLQTAPAGGNDPLGFSFESGDEFTEAPMRFDEYSSAMLDDLADIYASSRVYNRFSPLYLSVCTQMEKIIRHLGSCCVTKVVLEQEKITFPDLERLDIGTLYCCVSFNFRKCHAAVREAFSEKNILDLKLLNMEFRLYKLAGHLKSTAKKINMIRKGKIRAASILEREQQLFAKSSGSPSTKRSAAGDRAPASLPVLKSTARALIRGKKAGKLQNENIPESGVSPEPAAGENPNRETARPDEPSPAVSASPAASDRYTAGSGPQHDEPPVTCACTGPSKEERGRLRGKRKRKKKR